LQFTCEELDYLDSKAESQTRRQGQKEWTEAYDREEGEAATKPAVSRPGRAAPRRGSASH
jgi:hypothetical protein